MAHPAKQTVGPQGSVTLSQANLKFKYNGIPRPPHLQTPCHASYTHLVGQLLAKVTAAGKSDSSKIRRRSSFPQEARLLTERVTDMFSTERAQLLSMCLKSWILWTPYFLSRLYTTNTHMPLSHCIQLTHMPLSHCTRHTHTTIILYTTNTHTHATVSHWTQLTHMQRSHCISHTHATVSLHVPNCHYLGFHLNYELQLLKITQIKPCDTGFYMAPITCPISINSKHVSHWHAVHVFRLLWILS